MMFFLVAIMGSLAVLAFASYVQLRAKAAVEYRASATAFFDAADQLASRDDAPPELLDTVSALNDSMSDRRAAKNLLLYLSGETRWKDSDAFLRRKKILTEFFVRQPELELVYHEVILNWFLAVTALSPLVGKLARLMMSERTLEAAATRKRRPSVSGGGLPSATDRRAVQA